MTESNGTFPTNTALQHILHTKVIAVIRLRSSEQLFQVVEAVAAGGIDVIELTLTTPGAIAAIERLRSRDDLLVGAGSVVTASQAEEAIAAGAAFCASPIFDPEVLATIRAAGCASMPGACTPTEMYAAWRAGADLIKVFPMPAEGRAFIASILGPLPQLRLAPSGGVDVASAPALLRAGAAALNVGSWLTHDATGAIADPAEITGRARALRDAIGKTEERG